MGAGSMEKMRDVKIAYVFLLPSLILIFGFVLYPLGKAFWLSFYQCDLLGTYPTMFIKLDNFAELFLNDPIFWQAFKNSIIWTVGNVLIIAIAGLIFALLLSLSVRGMGFFRGCLLIPWILPTVVVALIWSTLYWKDYGLINVFLIKTKLVHAPIEWLGLPNTALLSLMVVYCWWRIPFAAIMLLAGLQNIDEQLYEVAKIDGADSLQRFRYITIPQLLPVMIVVLLISTIWAFNHFDIAWVLTGGGPVNYTQLLSIYVYRTNFSYLNVGYACAIGVIMMMILVIIAVFYVKRVLKGGE